MNAQDWQRAKRLFHQVLDLDADERRAWLKDAGNGDEEVRATVESLLQAHDQAGEFILEPALIEAGLARRSDGHESLIDTHVGPYQIIRELGRGGMGAVFLAVRADKQFEKQVAIKIVKRGMDTELILRRFVMERQILANLEHPNIARFLDGGTTPDGLPYFVMEYVEGEPITRYCEAHELDTTERLQLFRQACAAVQHAHQNLIVHRDLKPSNILVTTDGAPRLLDFGIAKLLNPDTNREADETASALGLMTPEYASPEQLRGLSINTATDVYSLGVVLYELLSGRRPFNFESRSPTEIARVLSTQQPSRPSEVVTRTINRRETTSASLTDEAVPRLSAGQQERIRRRLLGDLDNIVLKAMHKVAERRYASVQEFSEDIRRHLSGLPVTARPDTFSYRAGKFIQRHRAGVAAATILAVTLLSAMAVTSWQAHVARREHTQAQLRMAEERKLASSLINEVQRSLKDVPNSLTAQRMLAQKSLEYLNNLAKDAGDNPDFLGELAGAYQNLGYLQSWTLQDNPSALLSYERAIALARRRLVLDPQSFPGKRALADILGTRIEALNLMQRADDSAVTYVEKLNLEQQLMNDEPQSAAQIMAAAETSRAYGEVLRSIKRDDEAKANFQAAIDLGSRAVAMSRAQAATPQQLVDLSLMEEKLASMFEQLQELPEAAQSYRDAVTVASSVHAEHPEIVQALRNTTSSHWFLGLVLDRQGDHEGALENYRASLQTVRDATDANPSVDPPHSGEMKYSIVVGRALCKLGQKEEGVRLIRHGVDMTLALIASDQGNRQDTYYGSELLTWAVDGLAAAGLKDEAKRISLKMIGWAEEAAHNSPTDGGPRLRQAALYEQLGDAYSGYDEDKRKILAADRKDVMEAERCYQKGLDVLRGLNENFHLPKPIVEDRFNALQERMAELDPQPARQK